MWTPLLRRRTALALLGVLTLGPAGSVGAAPGAALTAPGDVTVDYRLPVDDPAQVLRAFDPPPHPWAAGHRGVDLALAPQGAVLAPAAGVVTFAGQVAGRPVLTLTHADGRRSSLEPVDATVQVGQVVTSGQMIGTLEESTVTHCAPLSCVHWGVREGQTYVDPLGLVDDHGPVVLLAAAGPASLPRRSEVQATRSASCIW